MGEVLPNSGEAQREIEICVYPGKDGRFYLYSDDGTTYAYEKGEYALTRLDWKEETKQLIMEEENTWHGQPERTMTVTVIS